MRHSQLAGRTPLALFIGLLLNGSAHGAVLQWKDSLDGSFLDASNWSPAVVPGVADTAAFNLGVTTPYVVSGIKGQIDRLVVGADRVILDGNGGSQLDLLAAGGSAPSLVVAESALQRGALAIIDGAIMNAQHAVFGAAGGSAAEVSIGASRLNLAGELTVGDGGEAGFAIEDGANVGIQGDLRVGAAANSAGEIDVRDRGTRLTVAGDTRLGIAGAGTLRIDHEARVELQGALTLGEAGTGGLIVTRRGQITSTSATLGAQAGGRGLARVAGADTAWDNSGDLSVGDAGSGDLGIEAGARLIVGRDLALGVGASGAGTVDVRGAGSELELGGELRVGDRGTGTLRLGAGALLDVGSNGVLGSAAGGHGVLEMDGAGTRWRNALDVAVGLHGTGTLTATAGALVESATNGLIGHRIGSIGTAHFDGTGTEWAIARDLHIGYDGDGTLLITEGARVRNQIGFVGFFTAGRGRVTVEGAGSLWQNADTLVVGYDGDGELNIRDSGLVTGYFGLIGANSSASSGVVTLTGAGSTLDITANLYVGGDGVGPGRVRGEGEAAGAGEIDIGDGSLLAVGEELVILERGRVHLNGGTLRTAVAGLQNRGRFDFTAGLLELSGGDLLLGTGQGVRGVFESALTLGPQQALAVSQGMLAIDRDGTVFVDGAGARLEVDGNLRVGISAGASLGITDGGRVDVGGHAELGVLPAGDGTLSVDGAGSQLTVTGALRVGDAGTAALRIDAGGRVDSVFGFLGTSAQGSGVALVRGTDSTWANWNNLLIGDVGSGVLTIDGGGQVLNLTAAIGNAAGADGVVLVRGAGSTWTHGEALLVGDRGTGALRIEDGGTVSNATAGVIGNAMGSTGEVTVSGPGSRWDSRVALDVGNAGTGALDVLAGARVEAGELFVGRNARGRVHVDGAASTLASGTRASVGLSAAGEIALRNGGRFDIGDDLLLGEFVGGRGTLDVAGGGSHVDVGGDLQVGAAGDGSVRLANGATLTVGGNGEVASATGSTGRVSLSGAGTQWQNAFDIAIGLRGAGELDLTDGATIAGSLNSLIGHQAGATGHARVAGSRSAWTTASDFHLGYEGDGELSLEDGALLRVDRIGYVGSFASGTGTATVSGAGTRWSNAGLVVGAGGSGTLHILDLALVSSVTSLIGSAVGSEGTVRVAAGGEWLAGAQLVVGAAGTGTLEIVDGGVLHSVQALLATDVVGRGSATVSGAGSAWINEGSLLIGGSRPLTSGGVAEVTVRDGGTLSVNSVLRLFDNSTLRLQGGTVRAHGLVLDGNFEFESGTLELTFLGGIRIGSRAGITGFFERSLSLTGNQHMGILSGGALIGPDGVLAIADGASFTAHGGSNFGTLLVDDGSLHYTATTTNAGSIDATGATLRFDGGLRNEGALRLDDSRISGDVDNRATIVLAGTNIFSGALSGAGDYAGSGNAVLEGSLNPGASPGVTQFGGDVTFADSHLLTIELAGLLPGVSHDQVQVAGHLSLGGTLEVELLDGYAPMLGDVFDIAIASLVDGEFSARLLPALAPGLRWQTLRLSDAIGSERYRLAVSAVPLPPGIWLFASGCGVFVMRARRSRARGVSAAR